MLITASVFAADRANLEPEQMSIATTGRILRVDLKNRTLKVRAAESQAARAPEIKESLWQRLGVKMPVMKMPNVHMPSISISLPGRNSKTSSPNEFMVITTDATVFQDGSDSIRLEDFRSGETVSIHGMLDGSTLKASRIAKWD